MKNKDLPFSKLLATILHEAMAALCGAVPATISRNAQHRHRFKRIHPITVINKEKMNTFTFRILFAIFLIAHGLITMSLATVPVPAQGALRTPYFPAWWRTDVDKSWPAILMGLNPSLVRTAGWILWLIILVFFVAAGVGLLGLPGLTGIWQVLALIASFVSLILLVLYWHPWLVMGVLLNIGIAAGVYFGWFTRWFAVK